MQGTGGGMRWGERGRGDGRGQWVWGQGGLRVQCLGIELGREGTDE